MWYLFSNICSLVWKRDVIKPRAPSDNRRQRLEETYPAEYKEEIYCKMYLSQGTGNLSFSTVVFQR